MSEITQGTTLPEVSVTHDLTRSVMYAGASGDFNPLHFDEEFASQISPTGGIIAHGMYSMGLASRVLTSWAGGPEKVGEVTVRFTKPWPLDTTTTFGGTVSDVTDGVATVQLWATNENGEQVVKGTGKVLVD